MSAVAEARAAVRGLPALAVDGKPGWADEVTVIVATFERPRCLARLLFSIRLHCPFLCVLVCESSREPLFEHEEHVDAGLTWYRLPRELGHSVAAARNYLIDRVDTAHVFLSDDDHTFTAQTDVARMLAFLDRSGYDVVAGAQGRGHYGLAVFRQRGRVVYELFQRHHGFVEPGVVRCDRTENVFLARTAAVRGIRWDPRMVAREHDEFFLRAARAGLRVAQMGGVYVGHDRACEASSSRLWSLLRVVVPVHSDRAYRRDQVGSGGPLRPRARRVRDLQRAALLESGIATLCRIRAPIRRRRVRRALEGSTEPR